MDSNLIYLEEVIRVSIDGAHIYCSFYFPTQFTIEPIHVINFFNSGMGSLKLRGVSEKETQNMQQTRLGVY